MDISMTDKQYYADIADAIRRRGGFSDRYLPREMAAAILTIPTPLNELINVVTSNVAPDVKYEVDISQPSVHYATVITTVKMSSMPRHATTLTLEE